MVTVRPAQASDSRVLWQWRNDAVARAASIDSSEVAWADHQRWFERSLSLDTRILLIALDERDERVGMVRFDIEDDGTAVVSINVAPASRGAGVGTLALRAGITWFHAVHPGMPLVAYVRTENSASRRLFDREGFTLGFEENGLQRMTLRSLKDASS